jgi:hypothetical protein
LVCRSGIDVDIGGGQLDSVASAAGHRGRDYRWRCLTVAVAPPIYDGRMNLNEAPPLAQQDLEH